MAWEEDETETLRERRVIVGSVECVGAWEVVLHVALCVCVSVCSISPQTFQTGVFMFELRSGTLCVWLWAVWKCVCMFHLGSNIQDRGLYVGAWKLVVLRVALCSVLGVCVYVPSWLKHSRQGSL